MNEEDDKIQFVEDLLALGKKYRDIQDAMKKKFGVGMSNTTLKKIHGRMSKMRMLEEKVSYLEEELALFKKLYFELLLATKKKLHSSKE
jgi:hypothetical protein